jgi:hypothetical protein
LTSLRQRYLVQYKSVASKTIGLAGQTSDLKKIVIDNFNEAVTQSDNFHSFGNLIDKLQRIDVGSNDLQQTRHEYYNAIELETR